MRLLSDLETLQASGSSLNLLNATCQHFVPYAETGLLLLALSEIAEGAFGTYCGYRLAEEAGTNKLVGAVAGGIAGMSFLPAGIAIFGAVTHSSPYNPK